MQTAYADQPDHPLLKRYRATRRASLSLCEPLSVEDYGLQAMPEVSPPKWHLAHTSWFFETFVLKPYLASYRVFHPRYEYLFNSYYNGVGAQFPRPQRGLLSRPTLQEVFEYRRHVDAAMADLLGCDDHAQRDLIQQRCELGIHHEQQHQELICTDIKYCFSINPLLPALLPAPPGAATIEPMGMRWLEFAAQDVQIGYQGRDFHFDNEAPAHRYHQTGFRFANRLVSNAEFLEFIDAGGYETATLWLSDGWAWKQANAARHPRYWLRQDTTWQEYTLYGLRPLHPHAPVSHVNFYEADAYARWSGKRLPSEQEWEVVALQQAVQPEHIAISLHPLAPATQSEVAQMFGQLWQWTRSSYAPYPGYRPGTGAIGEYNGKFMCNQVVLRGSSCVTAPGHARASYRNFFYPPDQWQYTGIRLADDL